MDGNGTMRVSDAERRRVADRLARAQAEGRLDLGEFDVRVRDAYGAVSRADLAALTADLPAEDGVAPAGVARATRPPVRRDARDGLGAAVAVWAVVSAVNVGIWAIVAVAASGAVHPWWIWVAGPWGVMLVVRALAERSGLAPMVPGPFPGLSCGARRHR